MEGILTYDSKVVYDNHKDGKSREQYIIQSVSVTDAETALCKEIAPLVSGEMSVRSLKAVNYGHIDDEGRNGAWYKCKIVFSIRQDNGKIKTTSEDILVYADTVFAAGQRVSELYRTSLLDWELVEIKKTQITGIIRWKL